MSTTARLCPSTLHFIVIRLLDTPQRQHLHPSNVLDRIIITSMSKQDADQQVLRSRPHRMRPVLAHPSADPKDGSTSDDLNAIDTYLYNSMSSL